MTIAHEIIEEIRHQVSAHDGVLAEARARRNAVFQAVSTFPGVLRTASTGSLAIGFINHPVNDGDGAAVLERQAYPSLGPDGDGVLPHATVNKIQNHIRPLLREIYPKVSVSKMKRGILVEFAEPLDDEQDPTVDLVIALNRREDDALWIPNLDENRWDPSHPERHVELFTRGDRLLRRTRAHVVRLGKAQMKQFETSTLSSFNVAALSWEAIEKVESIDVALSRFFRYAATEIAARRTDDPAGVSGPIKLPEALQRQTIVSRLQRAADSLERAVESGDDKDAVLSALAEVFFRYVEAPGIPTERNTIAQALRSGTAITLPLSARPTPATTSYGGGRDKR
ncbi:MAG: hypothetical protein ACR2NT_03820 [Acidimicrobiia bacterium]